MKKLTLLSALLAVVFTVNAGEMLLRAMTFNLRCPVEADGVNQWKFRKDIAADLVRFHDPDVWGAQDEYPRLQRMGLRLSARDHMGGDARQSEWQTLLLYEHPSRPYRAR